MPREKTIASLCGSLGFDTVQTDKLKEHSRSYLTRRTIDLANVPDETLNQLAADFLFVEHGCEHFSNDSKSILRWSEVTHRARIIETIAGIMQVQRKHATEKLHRRGPCTGCIFHPKTLEVQPEVQDGSSERVSTTPCCPQAMPEPLQTAAVGETEEPDMSDVVVVRAGNPNGKRPRSLPHSGLSLLSDERLKFPEAEQQPRRVGQEQEDLNDDRALKRSRPSDDDRVTNRVAENQVLNTELVSAAIYKYDGVLIGFKSLEDKTTALEFVLSIFDEVFEANRVKALIQQLTPEEKQQSLGIRRAEREIKARAVRYLESIGNLSD